MILDALQYYWPRVLLGLWFALAMTGLTRMRAKRKNPLAIFLLLFFLSPTMVSIVVEFLSTDINASILTRFFAFAPSDVQVGTSVIYFIFSDVVAIIIPVLILSWLMKTHWNVAAGGYLVYCVIDKLGLVMALSALSYFIIIVILLAASYFWMRNEMDYVVAQANSMDWRPVLHYLVGLFFLIDSLYFANRVFPDLESGVLDIKNLWIDMLAIVATIFYAAFAKLSLKAYKEQSQKLKYLLNHTSYGKEILSQRGKQFSPKVVDVFDSSFDQIKEIQQQFLD